MEVKIQKNSTSGKFSPVFGKRAEELYSRFAEKLSNDELEIQKKESLSILADCTNPNSPDPQSITNLVVGYVQSGKTMSFTGVSALAGDNGFRVIIYFAGNKTNLL